jgi:hypothetical protein
MQAERTSSLDSNCGSTATKQQRGRYNVQGHHLAAIASAHELRRSGVYDMKVREVGNV